MTDEKILTFVVPAYNMQGYVERCVRTLLSPEHLDDIEVIVVDDGSTDSTLEVAQALEAQYPDVVRAIHQENKGHGGAVNTGIANARGMYIKIVDADDWIGAEALEEVLTVLRAQKDSDDPLDMIVTNYVYDKVGKRHKHVVDYKNVMEPDKRIGWDDLGRFGIAQYLLMHSITFRTQVVRDSGMKLPEHTFYVDFIYAYVPFPWVKSIMYIDTPLYHYFIGREGQSVQTDVMIRRVDQLYRVNNCMLEATPEPDEVPRGLYRYMIHFLSIETSITSVFLILSRKRENYARQKELWARIDKYSPIIGHDARRQIPAMAINMPGPQGRWCVRVGYKVADQIMGFN